MGDCACSRAVRSYAAGTFATGSVVGKGLWSVLMLVVSDGCRCKPRITPLCLSEQSQSCTITLRHAGTWFSGAYAKRGQATHKTTAHDQDIVPCTSTCVVRNGLLLHAYIRCHVSFHSSSQLKVWLCCCTVRPPTPCVNLHLQPFTRTANQNTQPTVSLAASEPHTLAAMFLTMYQLRTRQTSAHAKHASLCAACRYAIAHLP